MYAGRGLDGRRSHCARRSASRKQAILFFSIAFHFFSFFIFFRVGGLMAGALIVQDEAHQGSSQSFFFPFVFHFVSIIFVFHLTFT
jgi:hypothetical protein